MDPVKGTSSVSTAPVTSSDEGDSDADDRDQEDVIEAIDVVNMTGNERTGNTCRLLKKKQSDCFSLCPYREYRAAARRAPRGAVTFHTICSLLKPMGATGCEIGAVMFELDIDGVGYRCPDDDLEEHARGALGRCTRLTQDEMTSVVSKMIKKLEDSRNEETTAMPIRGAMSVLSLKAKDAVHAKRYPHFAIPQLRALFRVKT